VTGAVVVSIGLLAGLAGTAGAQGRAMTPAGAAVEAAAIRPIVARQFARYPQMGPQDVYKLVFQAAMGSRHAGLDSAMAAQWLDREIASLAAGPAEPILDTISPDGRMVRVNLRPYLAAGGSRAALLDAFVRTARDFGGSIPRLRRELAGVERMAGLGEVPLPRAALHGYFERMRVRGYPAVEHSDAYESAYHPAYRVVLGALLPSGRLEGAR
jgi:hypothetical protein